MLIEALGNLVLVSTSIVVGLMMVSLAIAGFIGYRIASRRIEIIELDGTPSPSHGNSADSILEPAFSFSRILETQNATMGW